jgi:DNA-binding CsgD family transcriptional regulator
VTKNVDELSAGLYEAALNTSLIPVALENIAQSLGCYSYHQMVLDVATHQVAVGWTGNAVSDEVQRSYEKHYIHLDERPLFAADAGVGGVFHSSDITSAKTISQSEIYQDFLLPNGVGHCMGGYSFANEKSSVLVAFLGHADRKEFSPLERQMMAELMPHLTKSAALMFQAQRISNQQREDAMVLNTLSTAAITSGAKGNVLSMNKRAETLLIQGQHLRVLRGKLVAKGDSFAFAALLSRVLKTGVPESMSLAHAQVDSPVHVTVTFLAPPSSVGIFDNATLLVMVSQPGYQRVATAKQLMQIFRLSPAEARLARATAHGQDLEAYALAHEIKMTTVRTQMASIHAKTGVKRQTDLVRLVLSVPCAR